MGILQYSLVFELQYHKFSMIIRKLHDLLVPNISPLHMHQNIAGNITFYVGPECQTWYALSMTFEFFKDFYDFSRPKNQLFKFREFSGIP